MCPTAIFVILQLLKQLAMHLLIMKAQQSLDEESREKVIALKNGI